MCVDCDPFREPRDPANEAAHLVVHVAAHCECPDRLNGLSERRDSLIPLILRLARRQRDPETRILVQIAAVEEPPIQRWGCHIFWRLPLHHFFN